MNDYRPGYIKRITVDFDHLSVSGEWKSFWRDSYRSAYMDLTDTAERLAKEHGLESVGDGFILALVEFLHADLSATVSLKLRYARHGDSWDASQRLRVARFKARYATTPKHGRFVISIDGENGRRGYVHSVGRRSAYWRFFTTNSKQSARVYTDRRLAEMDSGLYQLSRSNPKVVRAAKDLSRAGMSA